MMDANNMQITHFQAGRIRLKVPAIRGSTAKAEVLGNAFRAIPGIKTLEINTLTGSVLITYDVFTLATESAARHLKAVLTEHFPSLDADEMLKWLGAPAPRG